MVSKSEYYEEYLKCVKEVEENHELLVSAYGYSMKEDIIRFLELFRKLPDGTFENILLTKKGEVYDKLTTAIKSDEC